VNQDGLPAGLELEESTRHRLARLIEEGRDIWDRFDLEVRQQNWHPFVAADYELVLQTLITLRAPGLRFLEWGSATGVITIMADMLGFDSYGIELDGSLVAVARRLAEKHESAATFAEGSFLPAGYEWRSSSGDRRHGTIGSGESAYPKLRHPLEDFDVVYSYPWNGEEPLMHDLMQRYGQPGGLLMVHRGTGGIVVHRNGRPVR
jgi:hypothetical protein